MGVAGDGQVDVPVEDGGGEVLRVVAHQQLEVLLLRHGPQEGLFLCQLEGQLMLLLAHADAAQSAQHDAPEVHKGVVQHGDAAALHMGPVVGEGLELALVIADRVEHRRDVRRLVQEAHRVVKAVGAAVVAVHQVAHDENGVRAPAGRQGEVHVPVVEVGADGEGHGALDAPGFDGDVVDLHRNLQILVGEGLAPPE